MESKFLAGERTITKDVFVLINFAAESKKITLPHTMKLLIQGKQADNLELPEYGMEVLTEIK